MSQTWLETRTPALNRRDIRLVEAARYRDLLPAEMRVDFIGPPIKEPMLWLPDAAAGAVTAAELGRPEWLETMLSVVQTIDVLVR